MTALARERETAFGADASPKATATSAPAAPTAPRSASQIAQERRRDFALFRSMAAQEFRNTPADARHDRMSARNGFHVAPGLRDAADAAPHGAEQRVFEVFYGERGIRAPHSLSNARMRREWPDTTETGAALLYRQGDDGSVRVMLYPARSSEAAPEEDAILLERMSDTAPLTGPGIMGRHWRHLRAYAEVTSIDGEPRLADHLRVAWLRIAKPTVKARVARPAKIGELTTWAAVGATALLAAAAVSRLIGLL